MRRRRSVKALRLLFFWLVARMSVSSAAGLKPAGIWPTLALRLFPTGSNNISMKALISVLFVLAAGCAHAQNQSEVYVCVNGDGTREYKNTGGTKGCKRVDLQGVSMIAAPPRRVGPAPAATPAGGAKTAASPSDFPRVDNGTQKQRDNDRMAILSDELKAEEKKLANLRQEFNNGEPERRGDERNYAKYQERVATMKDDIARVERNVESLRREISNQK